MYLLEGSWAPSDPLISGPPGIPGSPWPTEPNVFLELELVVELVAGTGVDVVPVPTETVLPALGEVGSEPACGSGVA